jgi:hypothetical protein
VGDSVNPQSEIALHKYVGSLIGEPFCFGKNDCPLFAAGALDAMIGGDRRERMTGLWSDQKTAWKYMRRNGSIADHLRAEGCVNVDPAYVQTGDFVIMSRKLAHQKQWHSVGVFLGQKIAIVSDEDGVILVAQDQLPEIDEVLRWQSLP